MFDLRKTKMTYFSSHHPLNKFPMSPSEENSGQIYSRQPSNIYTSLGRIAPAGTSLDQPSPSSAAFSRPLPPTRLSSNSPLSVPYPNQPVYSDAPKFPVLNASSPNHIVDGHPSEQEFASLDHETKLNLIKDLTEGDYAYRLADELSLMNKQQHPMPAPQSSHLSRSSPRDDSAAHGHRRRLNYNESFRNANNDGLFDRDDSKSSPRFVQIPSENVTNSANNSPRSASLSQSRLPNSAGLPNRDQWPSGTSSYTYDVPSGRDMQPRHRMGSHKDVEIVQTTVSATTTHGFPLFNGGKQKSTPDVSRSQDGDYDNNENLKDRYQQRSLKKSSERLNFEDEIVAGRTTELHHQNEFRSTSSSRLSTRELPVFDSHVQRSAAGGQPSPRPRLGPPTPTAAPKSPALSSPGNPNKLVN